MDRKYSGCINFEPIDHNFQDQLLRAKNNLFSKKGLLYSKNFTPRPYRTEPYGSVFCLPYRDQFLEKPLTYQYEAQSVLNLGLNRSFIEVAHFEYTMTTGAQLLQDSKNISKYSKMINFD